MGRRAGLRQGRLGVPAPAPEAPNFRCFLPAPQPRGGAWRSPGGAPAAGPGPARGPPACGRRCPVPGCRRGPSFVFPASPRPRPPTPGFWGHALRPGGRTWHLPDGGLSRFGGRQECQSRGAPRPAPGNPITAPALAARPLGLCSPQRWPQGSPPIPGTSRGPPAWPEAPVAPADVTRSWGPAHPLRPAPPSPPDRTPSGRCPPPARPGPAW